MQNCPDGRRSNSRLHVVWSTFSVSHAGTLFSAFYYIITYLFCQREMTKNDCYFLYKFTRCCVLERNRKQDVLFGAILRQHENVLVVGREEIAISKNKRLSKSKNQPVILSGERSSQSNFCGLSVSEQAEAQGIFAEAGYGLKSRWLTNGMLHQFKSHPNSLPYPFVAFAPRFCFVIHSAKLRLRKALRDFLRSE